MTTSLIDTHLCKIFGGISKLSEGYPTHAIALLTLVYASIDQLAWLDVEDDKHNGNDFQEWVDRYMKPEKTLGCTAQQMWAARNGILHMGTAESSNTRNGVKKLCYYVNSPVISRNENYVFVSLETLVQVFMDAAARFAIDAKGAEHNEAITRKIQRVLMICVQ